MRYFWNDSKYLFQPLTNAAVSTGTVTIKEGNIETENISFPLKQIQRDLRSGDS